MEALLQIIAGTLIAVILCLVLDKQGKDTGILLSVTVCCMILFGAGVYLRPIVEFVKKLATISKIDNGLLTILMKAVGISLLTEICVTVCEDAGKKALGKALQITGSCAVIWLSIPLMEQLLSLIERILGSI